MRFLLLNQFYPPDAAPTGRMLHDLARILVGRGHEVRVVCSCRAYEGDREWAPTEVKEGVEVVRIRGIRFRRASPAARVAAYGVYVAGALRAAITGPAPDVVVSLTTPPFLGLLGALIARLRRSRHAHWIMDLYPDALRAHWGVTGNWLMWRVLEGLGRAQFRGAAVLVAPGPYVEERLRKYAPSTVTLRSVPLWATDGLDGEDVAGAAGVRKGRGWSGEDLVLMYSGNMGLGHCFAEFLDAARRLGRNGPVWVFIGDGPRRGEIEAFRAQHPEARMEVLPYVDPSGLAQSLAAGDVHLISVAPGWEGVMVPSKLQNVFAVGRPAIFVGPAASEPARWIKESGGGWVVLPGDLDALLLAIEAARDPADRLRRGQAAQRYARAHFNRERNCQLIADLLEGRDTQSAATIHGMRSA